MMHTEQFHTDFFYNLHDNLPGMFYRCLNDPDWTMIYISKGCKQLTGYEVDELLSGGTTAFGNIIHIEDQAWLWEKCSKNLNEKIPCNNHYRILTKNGIIRWVAEIANGVYDPQGVLQYIEGYIWAMDEVQELEMVSQAFASYQKAVNEHSLVSIADLQGNFIFVNDHFLVCSEYEREELIGQNMSLLNSGFHDKAFFRQMWETILRGEIWHDAIRNKTKSGQLCWLDMVISPVFDADGQIIHFLAIMNVISDRIEAKKHLIESENRLKMAQSIAKIGSWEYVVATRQLIWSEELYRLFDVSPDEKGDLLQVYYSRIHPDASGALNEVFLKTLTNGIPYEIEHPIILPDGTQRYLFCTGAAEMDTEGQIVKIYGTSQDITSRKEKDFEIKSLAELNKQIIDSSDELFYVFKVEDPVSYENPLVFVSDKVKEFYGVSKKELMTNHRLWFDSIHPDDVENVRLTTEKL